MMTICSFNITILLTDLVRDVTEKARKYNSSEAAKWLAKVRFLYFMGDKELSIYI